MIAVDTQKHEFAAKLALPLRIKYFKTRECVSADLDF
jgi:hypothetical protein